MADERISAMPAATEVLQVDVVPIVQGGVNKKTSKQILLEAATGEEVAFRGLGVSFVGIDNTGRAVALADAGKTATLQVPSGGQMGVDAAGGCFGTATIGQNIYFTADGTNILLCYNDGSLQFGPFGTPIFLVTPGSQKLVYSPGAPGNWTGGVNDLFLAMDRVAAALTGLLLGPIP